MNHRFKGRRGKRRLGNHQLLDDRAFAQTLLELHEPLPFPPDEFRVLDIRLQAVDHERRLAAVLAVGNPMCEHREGRLFPAAFKGRHTHVSQRHDAARANLRLQGLTSEEVFHDFHTQKTISVVVLIRRIVGLDQTSFVEHQRGKTENAEFVCRQICHARGVWKRLLELLVRKSAVHEPRHGIKHRPDVHGDVEVLQPGRSPAMAAAQTLQRSA